MESPQGEMVIASNLAGALFGPKVESLVDRYIGNARLVARAMQTVSTWITEALAARGETQTPVGTIR